MCLNPCKFVCWVLSFAILFLLGLLFYVTVMGGEIVVMGVHSGEDFVMYNGRAIVVGLLFPLVWWSASILVRLVLWEMVRYPTAAVASAIASNFRSSDDAAPESYAYYY